MSPLVLFVVPIVFNVLVAAVLYVVRGGWRAGGRIEAEETDGADGARPGPRPPRAGGPRPSPRPHHGPPDHYRRSR